MVLYLKYLVWYRAVPYDTGHGTVPPVPVSSDSWYVPGTRYSWQVGFAAAISHARMRLSRLGRIGHAGRIAGRVGATVAPFLSPTMWEQQAGMLGGGGGRAGVMGPGLFG